MISEISGWHGAGKPLKSAGSAFGRRRKALAVPTKYLAKRPLALEACRHVSAPQDAPEGRQRAPLLEHRGEPPGVRRADGAAPCAISGRDQRRSESGLVSDDRGVG